MLVVWAFKFTCLAAGRFTVPVSVHVAIEIEFEFLRFLVVAFFLLE